MLQFGCKSKPENNTPKEQVDKFNSGNLSLIEADDLVKRADVHPILLDENNFRVNGLRVGQQTFLKAETPIIIYEMPPQADFVEILRCPENVIVHGGADTLDYVELGSKDLETETRIYQRNNFWEAAVATSGCVLIATSYTDTSYEDTSAPTGTFNYYVRACVDQDRLLNVEEFSSTNCSRQVSRSSQYNHVNKRQKAELEALVKASEIRSKIDTINRQIINKTIQLNQQLFECQEKHQTQVVSQEKKSAIGAILGGVIGFGIPVLGTLGFKARQFFKPDYNFSYKTVLAKKKKLFARNISATKLSNQKESLRRSILQHQNVLDERIKQIPAENSARRKLIEREMIDTDQLARIVDKIDPEKKATLEDLKSFDENRIGVERAPRVSKATRAAQALATTTIAASSALLISHAFAAGSQSISNFPRDAKACYGTSPKHAADRLFCSCAKALSSQEDLNTLAEDLEQTMRLQQQYLNKAEVAREPEV